MSSNTYRRFFGLAFGLIAGGVYTLVSQTINFIVVPGIPFYEPPFGPLGNIILGTLLGGALGSIAAWPETGIKGIVGASLFGSLAIMVASWFTGQTSSEILTKKLISLLFIFLPTAAVISPLFILVRWIINREETADKEAQTAYIPKWRTRLAFPIGFILVAAGIGFTALLPEIGRGVTPRMETLIQSGIQAKRLEDLPKPLQPPAVTYFQQHADKNYTIQWDKDEQNKYAIPRPVGNASDQSTVIARFDSGYLLACVFPGPTGDPECKDFE